MEYGLIGEKLGHSFSKEIHERIGKYKYDLIELDKNQFDSFMMERNFKAINVTMPYKKDVIKYLDYISDEAKKINAVNTIMPKCGQNKDWISSIALLTHRYKAHCNAAMPVRTMTLESRYPGINNW